MLLVAVPGLQWSDLADMPRLSAYTASSAVGDLSVRGETTSSRCADGSLTFAAGNRADAGGATGCSLAASTLRSLRGRLGSDRFGGDIAAFGDALASANVSATAVGANAVPLVARRSGTADHVVPAAGLATALDRPGFVATVNTGLYDVSASDRAAAARSVDSQLSAQLDAAPPSTMVVVAGTSDGVTGGPDLHVLVVHGPGWSHVELDSPTTAGTDFVQLVDLAPTILARFGIPVPRSMIGRPARLTRTPAPSASAFADANRHAKLSRNLGGYIRASFAILGAIVLGLVLATHRQSTADDRRRRFAAATVWLARLAVGFPVGTYLVQVLPWWRWGLPAYAALLLGWSVVVAAGLTALSRRSASLAVGVAAGVSALVLAVDQVVGSNLQVSAPLGNGPLVAGRFAGMGNIGFAVLGGAALTLAAVWGSRLRSRRSSLVVAAVIGVVAIVVDVAPSLGDDFGGALSLVPALAILLALLAGIRLTVRRIAVAVGAGILAAVAVAAADYSRPASSQTHIGHFVGEVLHGGAGKTLYRKLYSETHSFGNVPVTASVVLLVLAAIVYRRQTAGLLRRLPGGRAAAIAVAVVAVLGTALNDSGVVIAEFAALVGFLALLCGPPELVLPADRADPGPQP